MTQTPDFDTIATYYDRIYADRDEDIEMWLELAALADGDILEIGSGTGRILMPLAEAGYNVSGVEISTVALDAVTSKIKAGNFTEQVHLYQGDMCTLNLPKKDFSLAFIPINTFMHCLTITDQLATLTQLYEHLQPEGRLIIDLYHPHPDAMLEADGRVILASEQTDEQTGSVIQWFVSRQLIIDQQIQNVTFCLDEIKHDGRIYRRTFSFPMRYIHRFEMEHLLTKTGFTLEQVLGDYDLSPFYAESPRMIFIANKSPVHSPNHI